MTPQDHQCTALLPMKAHSERVTNKNRRPFGEKPLYHHVLGELDRCDAIDLIVINTDSPDIAAEACTLSPKVHIHERPESIRGDLVPMNTIIAHDLARLPDRRHFLQTHSTNPLLRTETIVRAIHAYFEGLSEHDSLFSVTEWRTRFYDSDLRPVNHEPSELIRTQDLPPLFEENSNFYIFSQASFARRRHRIGTHPAIFVVDRMEAIDIDTETDFVIAEAIFGARRNRKPIPTTDEHR